MPVIATAVGHLVVLGNVLGVYTHLLVSLSPQPNEVGAVKGGN